MSWYNEAVFYHIYPLGMLGCPKNNDYGEVVHRLRELDNWIDHIKEIGCNAIYIGPLFKSVGHGYETTDYYCLDNRLGDNEDLKRFVKMCHENDIKVIFDGVFNHTGRDFFAFKDIQEYRENSRYLNWYCNVNFWGNNEYNDGFSYDNWGGFNLLVKLNQRNPEVQDYICDVIRFWVREFDVDGIRLDAADVLDFDFMKRLRSLANEVKEDFWLMGEVIHGDYSRWVNNSTLHAVTNYSLHKALYSSCNDHNFFETAHTVKRLLNMGNVSLYNFVDNHDVERIVSKLNNKNHYLLTSIMEYLLPGVPSVYYGSEYGIEGKKYRGGSDDDIRPYLDRNQMEDNYFTDITKALGNLRKNNLILSYGDYQEVELSTTCFSFRRSLDNVSIYACLNNGNDGHVFHFDLNGEYKGLFSGKIYSGNIEVYVDGNSGEVLVPSDLDTIKIELPKIEINKEPESELNREFKPVSKPIEEMSVTELQDLILSKMERNGTPMSDQIIRSVRENNHLGSLQNWARSF